MAYLYTGILFSLENEGNSAISYIIDETAVHSAK
jgi:hypothetical protein